MSLERFAVPRALAGQRVDRVVAIVTGRSRREVAELIAEHRVRVAGRVATRQKRVVLGEELEVELDAAGPAPSPLVADATVAFGVVYEDPDLVVVDKPAGVVVHPGAGQREHTLAAGLIARFPDLAAAAADGTFAPERPGLVHRLDKQTSGLLVVARNEASFRALSAQLAERTMGRRYVTLVRGTLPADAGTIDAPIARSLREPTKMAVRAEGRTARTHYEVLERYGAPLEATLCSIRLETGRTHQIRVHFAAIGHPVLGDVRYGGACRELPLARPFLHATELRLRHPRRDEELVVTSALPEELQRVLDLLRATPSPPQATPQARAQHAPTR